MGAINPEIIENRLHWTNIKDFFSLLKNFCMSIKSIIKFQISIEEYNQTKGELFNMEGVDNV